MRAIVAVTGLVLGTSVASAGPGVVVAARVDAFTSPSQEATVAQQLRRGTPVCVLDEASYDGILFQRPGWLAIRLPSGVGYVAAQAVELTAPAGASCGAPTPSNAPPTPSNAPPTPSNPSPTPSHRPTPSNARTSDAADPRVASAAPELHEIAAAADVPDAASSDQIYRAERSGGSGPTSPRSRSKRATRTA